MKKRCRVALLVAGIGSIPCLAMAQPVDAPDANAGREAPDSDRPRGAPTTEPSGDTEAATEGVDGEERDLPTDEDEPDRREDAAAEPPVAPQQPAAGAPRRAPSGAPLPSAGPGTSPGIGLLPRPTSDASALQAQGAARPKKPADAPEHPKDQIFADDWWKFSRPVFEIHGYFRLRAELFQNFSLGRRDPASAAIWPQPTDNFYGVEDGTSGTVSDQKREVGPILCTRDERGVGDSDNPYGPGALIPCKDNTQAGANIRFRLNPELHVSDNVRIASQLDILDNVTLGSTPSGAYFQPAAGGGYETLPRSGYAPVGALDDTIVAPASGINGVEDAIRVKRVWGEYSSPVGELRFGRMPNHWGIGMMYNAGDGYDDDYQSTIDRIQFITGLKPLDLYLGLSWDFPNEGPISSGLNRVGGQPYDVAQLDDVNQWSLIAMRNQSPQLTKLALAKGKLVFNVGTYIIYRKQLLALDKAGPAADTGSGAVPNATHDQIADSYSRRGANIWLPDVWFEVKYKKFKLAAEAAGVLGSFESLANDGRTELSDDEKLYLRQYGYALEMEQLLVEDRLKLQFRHGWTTGDASAFDPNTVGDLTPGPQQVQVNDDTDSTFRMHPNYRVDLILFRNLLTRVEGAYYFRPDVEYDFMRKEGGQRMGGGIGFIWSRATQAVQTPGHARDLGIELNGKLYFQAKDGALNDDPDKMGGFYTMLQYGVLFPLAGLDYQSAYDSLDTKAAQILRWYMGILF